MDFERRLTGFFLCVVILFLAVYALDVCTQKPVLIGRGTVITRSYAPATHGYAMLGLCTDNKKTIRAVSP